MDDSRFPERTAVLIGERVRSKRLQDGLTEEAVARVLNCGIENFRAAEAGEAKFTAENIVSLCSILRVTPSWFFEDLT